MKTLRVLLTFLTILAIFTPAVARAQLISLKTVPVAAGDQFLIFPSQRLGMGGVSIAVDDSLLDPFVNPAKGARLRGTRLFGAPTFYRVSGNDGAARTLPVGALFGSPGWFGGLSLSMQQLESPTGSGGVVPLRGPAWQGPALQTELSQRSANNIYAFGMLGARPAGGRVAVGASLFWAGLDAVDGVDLLYALSQKIEQFGQMVDYRVGLLAELGGDRWLEALLLRNRFNMTHDVTYVDWVWDRSDSPTVRTRLERNLDRTDTWGLHLGYREPLGRSGWRIGGILTGNLKSHPKIPNYEVMNIPRDPGNSWAYNFGLGLSRTEGPATFGIDLIYEPIWSDTWAEAETSVVSRSGRIIPAGGRTVENDFRFSNGLLRIGIGREEERIGFQLGLVVRQIRYWLKQHDNVQETRREQEERWMEWTPSWGLSLKFPEFDIRYVGRVTTGTGRPGVAWTGPRAAELGRAAAADFIVAPSGPLTLQEARVLTHQVSFSMPIGR